MPFLWKISTNNVLPEIRCFYCRRQMDEKTKSEWHNPKYNENELLDKS